MSVSAVGLLGNVVTLFSVFAGTSVMLFHSGCAVLCSHQHCNCPISPQLLHHVLFPLLLRSSSQVWGETSCGFDVHFLDALWYFLYPLAICAPFLMKCFFKWHVHFLKNSYRLIHYCTVKILLKILCIHSLLWVPLVSFYPVAIGKLFCSG